MLIYTISVYKQPPRSTQPSIPKGYVNRLSACLARIRQGTFTFVGWQVTLCDPTWQVTKTKKENKFLPLNIL